MIDSNIEFSDKNVTVKQLVGSQGAVINVFINAYFNCSKEYTKFISIYNIEQLLLLFTGVELKAGEQSFDASVEGSINQLSLKQVKQVFDVVMIKRYALEEPLFDVIDLKKSAKQLSSWEREVYNFAIAHPQTIIALDILNNASAVDVYKHMQSIDAIYNEVNQQNNKEVA